jgi:hypothetical protein
MYFGICLLAINYSNDVPNLILWAGYHYMNARNLQLVYKDLYVEVCVAWIKAGSSLAYVFCHIRSFRHLFLQLSALVYLYAYMSVIVHSMNLLVYIMRIRSFRATLLPCCFSSDWMRRQSLRLLFARRLHLLIYFLLFFF